MIMKALVALIAAAITFAVAILLLPFRVYRKVKETAKTQANKGWEDDFYEERNW